MGACCSKADSAVHSSESVIAHELHAVSESSGSFLSQKRGKSAAGTVQEQDATGSQPATPSAVKVAVVVRPLLQFEQQKNATSIVTVAQPNKILLQPVGVRAMAGGGDGQAEFTYDRVYHATDAQVSRQLYQEMVAPVMERFCQGFNACVLAYGQTGSGKTYQMGAPAMTTPSGPPTPRRRTNTNVNSGSSGSTGSSSAAVLPQACSQLLEYMQAAAAVYDVQLKVSYVEIYNEVIQDLLAPTAATLPSNTSGSTNSLAAVRAMHGGSSSSNGSSNASPMRTTGATRELLADSPAALPGLFASSSSVSIAGSEGSFVGAPGGNPGGGGGSITIYEDAAGQIVLDGVTEAVVTSAADVAMVLQRGSAVRVTAAHKLNQQSSRSHAIFTLTLQQHAHASKAQSLPPELRCLCSKLHLVDLAGSERAKETGTTGQRFAEGVSINKGLLELGNVINALTEGTSRRHIPYRNSKLTRLLQDCLGGTSETLFMACISPADSNREHTLSTLRYASRAMAIKNSLVRSTMSPGEELAYLRDLVASLQAENGQLKQALSAAGYCVDIALATGAVKDVPGSVQQQGEEQQQQQCRLYVQAC